MKTNNDIVYHEYRLCGMMEQWKKDSLKDLVTGLGSQQRQAKVFYDNGSTIWLI